jgi:hypothetical protein
MALDEVHTGTRVSFQVRSLASDGLEYGLEELVSRFGFKAEAYTDIASRKTLGSSEEANMLCLAYGNGVTVLSVHVWTNPPTWTNPPAPVPECDAQVSKASASVLQAVKCNIGQRLPPNVSNTTS